MNDADRENLETRVLVLAPTVKDVELTRAILARAGIACVGCPDQVQMCEQLTAGAGAVLIAEEAVRGGDGCLVEWLGRQPLWSDLPVLILARAGANSVNVAWAMDQLGNVTVLERPARVAALVSVVRTALRARQRQYQLCDQLVESERLSEERDRATAMFRAVVESAPVGVCVLDADMRYRHINRELADMNGLPIEAHIGRTVGELVPELLPTIEPWFQQVMTTGQPVLDHLLEGETARAPEVRRAWVESWFPVCGPDGRPEAVGVVVREVTEERRIEERLRASEDRFRLAAEAVNGIIYEWDILTGHVERQRGLYEVLGYHAAEVPPTAAWWREQIHPDDLEVIEQQFMELAGNSNVGEYRVRHKDGRWLHVEDRAVLQRGDDGRPARMVGCTVDVTARKEAEEQMRYSEQLHRVAFDESPTGMVYVGADGRLIKVNPAMCEITGYPAEELVGMKVYDLTHPDDLAHDAELVTPFLRGDTPTYENDKRYVRKDGSVRWVSITARMVTDAAGNPLHTVGIVLDITERKRAEQALADRTELLSGVLEGMTDVIFVKDLNGHIVLVNTAFAAAARSTPEQLVGKTDEDWFPPDVAAAVRQQDKAVIAGGSPMQFEETIPVAGEPRVFLTLKAPLRDGDGRVVGILGIGRDITERKRAEEAISRLVAIVESSHDALFGEDLNRIITSWNPGAEQIFGYRADEIVGTSILRLIPEAQQDEEHALQQKIAAGERGGTFEGIRRARDGREFHASITVSPLKDAAGKVIGTSRVVRDITEQHETAAALRAGEERMRLATEATSVGIWQWNVLTGEIRWDAQLFRIYGITPTPDGIVDYTDWSGALLPEDLAENEAILQDTVRRCGSSTRTFRIRRRDDGECRHVNAVETVRVNDRGLAEWVVGTNLDITDRKQAERALHASEARLRRVFESNVIGMIHWDLDRSLILDANAEFFRMTGYTREDLTNGALNFRTLTPPEWTERNEAGIRTLRADGFAAAYEKEYFCKDGSRVPLIIAGTRFEDSPSEGMSFLIDISERKRAEQVLRESETRLGGILRQSPAGIVQTDAAGCMTLVNPRWCEMFGYTETELLGRNILEITHPSSVAPTAAALGRLAAGGPDFQIEKAYCRKDGSVLRAQSNVAAVRSPAGEFLGLVAVVLDVGERLRTEEELRRLAIELSEADRRKDVFLATLAHELRNPLAPIRNGLEVIKLAGANGTVEQARAMMDRQLTQLVRLVDDLLDVSRVTSGKLELRKGRVELRAVIDAAVETSQPCIEQAGHELVVVVPDEPIFVDGDAARLAQVVSNLLNNSAKYTHRGGHVRLTVGREDGTAVVSVKDDGIGIPPAMLGRVFEMFTQVDRTLEKTTGGLGIGLSLVKGLMEMHGGTIEAKSDGEGMGSEFVVRLPVVTPVVAGPDRPDGQTSEGAPPALRRILVVDDNQDAAISLAMMLNIMGNETQTAHDGLQALDVAAQFRPDVVLMDIGMPKLNGYEAARRIREQTWGQGMVLVALTGWGQDEDKRKSHEAGFDAHLVKPVDPTALDKLLKGLKTSTAQ